MKPVLVAQALGAVLSPFHFLPYGGDPPVCIVGAGPGGLTVAHELEAKGIQTVIFEKQELVGGKCQAHYTEHGTFHPLGALLFTNQTYKNTLPLVLDAGVEMHPGISPQDWSRFLYGPGDQANQVRPEPTPNKYEMAMIVLEISRYTTYWEQNFAPKYSSIRYVNGVPDEFAVPMSEWLESNGFNALPNIMKAGMVPYGYGDINETPALYMLQYFTPEILGVFVGLTPAYIVDFYAVFAHYARSVKGPIHLSTEINEIDRSGKSPVIKYTVDGSSKTQRCASVVLAFPPTRRSLDALNMPLTDAEHDVFSKIRTTPYWSGAVETSTEYQHTYQQNPFMQIGEPVAFLRLFEDAPIATTWLWGNIGSRDEAIKRLIDTITAVQAGANITAPDVTAEDVKALRRWSYFPHFSAEELRKDPYAAFSALQGDKNTYYTSGLNGFETVEFSIRGAKDLVETFF
ncbi:FAD/NAD-P-binding domain-containing protein [Trametopsis cervina]|nr:FAD/NAD-P-binding domain-containing protein [Trametopsis cervina]